MKQDFQIFGVFFLLCFSWVGFFLVKYCTTPFHLRNIINYINILFLLKNFLEVVFVTYLLLPLVIARNFL